jgi:hypothetical protein
MQMSDQFHVPLALPWGEEYTISLERGREENNSCPCRQSMPGRPARNLGSIVTEFPRLQAT